MGKLLMAVVVLGLASESVEAQSAAPDRKWTIELYGGWSSFSGSSSGTAISSFPIGAPFTLASGQPSRAVPSWYFGDGAVLLNQVLTQFTASSGGTLPRITPLDAALKTAGATRANGGAFGARVGRTLTTKLGVEFNVERGLGGLTLTDALKDGLKKTSDSFNDAFRGLLGTAPITGLAVTSTLTVPDPSNAQTRIAGTLKWTVSKGKKVDAYLAGGGGLAMSGGKSPEATLSGKYSFRFFGTFPMDETDRVTLSVAQPKSRVFGVVGGGLTYDLGPRSGVRADIRVHLGSTGNKTTLATSPLIATQTPTSVLATAATVSPGLQFSTQAGTRSTLGGPNATLTLFTDSGLSRQMSFTIGLFKRF